jgi:pyruvate-formate lyase
MERDAEKAGERVRRLRQSMLATPSICIERAYWMTEAPDKNFEGCEEVLHILSLAPKFGNDDDYVDSIVNDVPVHGSDQITKVKCHSGGRSTTAAASPELQNDVIRRMQMEDV